MLEKIKVTGVDGLKAFLKDLPRGTRKAAIKAFAEYLIGDMGHGLKHYQAYQYITRKKAYGETFVSDKQRRYVMAAIRDGRIDPGVPHRTGNTQRGYYMKETKGGYGATIGNDTKGAYYTRDDEGQARLNMLAGWLKKSIVIKNSLAGAYRHAQAAVNAALKMMRKG